jgi:hypothetical protein
MKAVCKQFGAALLLALLAGTAGAQNATKDAVLLRGVDAVHNGGDLQIRFLTSAPVKPLVTMATNPDRLVVILPNTIADHALQQTPANDADLRDLTVAEETATPPGTRVVLKLSRAMGHTLRLTDDGFVLILKAEAQSQPRRSAPSTATSDSFGGIFRRRRRSVGALQNDPDVPEPATNDSTPAQPPAAPVRQRSRPTAEHPDFGSLQQGLASPAMGSPGAGVVPEAIDVTPGFGPPLGDVARQNKASLAKGPRVAEGSLIKEAPVSKTEDGKTADVATNTMQAAGKPVAVSVVPMAPPQTEKQLLTTEQSTASAVRELQAPSVATNSTTVVLPGVEILHPRPAPEQAAAPSSAGIFSGTSAPVTLQADVLPLPQPSIPVLKLPVPAFQKLPEGGSKTGADPMEATPAAALNRHAKDENSKSGDAIAGLKSDESMPSSDVRQELGAPPAINSELRTVFKVKYVAEGVAYLDGGKSSGLQEGLKLQVKDTDLPVRQGDAASPDDPRIVAELVVRGLADTSAVADIHEPKRTVKPGDLAYLSSEAAQAVIDQRTLSATRKYPLVIAFTEGDPLDEEVREEIPRPPPPSVNRARGRIGFDYLGTITRGGAGTTTGNLGIVLRADVTRLYGTYWNVGGYWRGRLDSRSSGQQTLQDLINRTYHLSMTYDNPGSRWVAGFGRLYLPWAASLDTIDGGYIGRRVAEGVTAGAFAGSTPDPTSWNYNPQQRIGGSFINFQGGTFEGFRFTSTTGFAVNLIGWQMDRPFVFGENAFYYKRYLSIYHSMQADSPSGNAATPAPGVGLGRSFLTVRVQPHPRLELNLNHSYLRGVPTFDPQLIGTGLLDKYLFQGLSGGARVEVVKNVSVYATLGRSNRTGDTKNSLNQMYGITFGRVPVVGLRADAHYSKFTSSFGSGSYRALSFSRALQEGLRMEVLAGDQTFTSSIAGNNGSRFVNLNLESSFGAHYFTQGGFTVSRGQLQSYDQWMLTFGYRFDSKSRRVQ